jgi:hypothetical protein
VRACSCAALLGSCARARPLIGAEESIQPLERFLFVEAKRVSFFHVVVVVVADLSTRLSCSECGQMEAMECVAAVAVAATAATAATSSMSLGRSRSK